MNFSDVNIFDPNFCENRYDVYARLDRSESLYFSHGSGCWIIQDFNLASEVLNNGSVFSSKPYQQADSVLLGADNPEHALHRKAIENYYSKHVYWRIPNLQSISDSVCSRLTSRLASRDSFDVIKEFVIPYTVTLGFYLSGLDLIGNKWNVLDCDEDHLNQVIEDCNDLYFKWNLIDSHLNDFLKSDDAPSFLGVFEDLEKSLSHLQKERWFGFLKTMLIASSETPSALTGAAVRLLVSELNILNRVEGNPTTVRQFLYEVLRYNSPAQLTLRTVVEDTVVVGHQMAAGDLVAVMLGFIHRDENRFQNPNKFDIERPKQSLLSFGRGAHECIGKHVAMTLAEVAVLNIGKLLSGKKVSDLKYNTSPQVFAIASMTLSEENA